MYFEIIVSFHQVYQEELGLKKLSISAFSTQSSTANILKCPRHLMMSQAFYLFVQEVTYILFIYIVIIVVLK